MTAISILLENPGETSPRYRAVAGNLQSAGKTPGEALDALTSQLQEAASGTLIIVQQLRPDQFFTAGQQQRLEELMRCWRTARDTGTLLPPEEQAELMALVDAEVRATAERAAALVGKLTP